MLASVSARSVPVKCLVSAMCGACFSIPYWNLPQFRNIDGQRGLCFRDFPNFIPPHFCIPVAGSVLLLIVSSYMVCHLLRHIWSVDVGFNKTEKGCA
jgi:hypothetical protein